MVAYRLHVRKRSCNRLNEVVKLVPLRSVADGVRDIANVNDGVGGALLQQPRR